MEKNAQHTPTPMDVALAFAWKSLNDACLCESFAREDGVIREYGRGTLSLAAAHELNAAYGNVDNAAHAARAALAKAGA